MNAITARARTNDHDNIANTFGCCTDGLPALDNPNGHRIDQRIALIALVEIYFAGYGGDTEGITIIGDAMHHTAHEILCAVAGIRVRDLSKAQRIECGDRSSTHGKNIPENSADSCGGTLIRLDGRWM